MQDITTASKHFFEGLKALNGGDLSQAETNFLKALELAPDRPSVLTNLSIVYTQQNKLTQALELVQKALESDSGEPLYWLQNGIVQLRLEDYDGALNSLNRALEKNPSLAEAHNNLGGTFKELNRFEEALASYDRAISLKPGYAEAYCNRGIVLRKLSRLDEALESYEKAVSLKPDYAEAYNNRGVVLKELDRLEDALSSYEKAISLRPDYAEAYSHRGNVLNQLNRLDDAMTSFDKAIELKPDSALVWLNSAKFESETGQFEEAEVKYQKARSLAPKAVAPLCGIAEVKKFEDNDPLLQDFQALLSSSSLSDEDRARLYHAYGKICNDLGRYDDAINYFSMGKRLLKSTFSIQKHSENYAALKRLFTPQFFAERSDFGVQDERPVFIVGMPRSGTTLSEQILASHSLADGLGELQDIPSIVRKWCGRLHDSQKFTNSVLSLKRDDVREMAEAYLQTYQRSTKNAVRIIDKRPHNYEWLGIIALMFPRAHIVHCRRDPLDNCVSMYVQKFNDSHGYNQDLATLGRYYREYADLMKHWSAVLPMPIHDREYEKTVADLETSSRALVSFVGLEWDPNCLNYHENNRRVNTPSRWQVRQPLYDKSVGRWRRYEKQLDPLKEALGDAIPISQ